FGRGQWQLCQQRVNRGWLLKGERFPHPCFGTVELRLRHSLHLSHEWRKDSLTNRMRQLFDNILPACDELRSLPDQRVRAESLCRRDVPGHGKNFSTEFEAKTHRDQRA